jgi:energy-coupling factor transport system ATP-binding protein
MIIDGTHISFSYSFDGFAVSALRDVSVHVARGELLAILGCNGCGKSTLVRQINALLPLRQGQLHVAGLDLSQEDSIWRVRRLCGMVFQNPDNQFVSPVVEEDIAFGLENYQVPRREIGEKVAQALHLVGLDGFEKRSPHTLSGGQKQRAALAGVLALEPEILIFDEATAMLDPYGRAEVLRLIEKLHREGKTVLMITHYVEEAVRADRVLLMSEGRILAQGTPRAVLTDRTLMEEAGLLPPVTVRLYEDLKREGIVLARCPLTAEELVEELCRLS